VLHFKVDAEWRQATKDNGPPRQTRDGPQASIS